MTSLLKDAVSGGFVQERSRMRAFLKWHRFEPLYLPPYSPDLNPIERLWLLMKDRWFNNHVCRNLNELIARLDRAILDMIGQPEELKTTISFGKLL